MQGQGGGSSAAGVGRSVAGRVARARASTTTGITGPPWSGRSYALETIAHVLAGEGVPARRIHGARASREVPLSGLLPLLADTTGPSSSDVLAAARSLRAALEVEGATRRSVLLVDDAERLDEASATILAQLAHDVHLVLTTTAVRLLPAPLRGVLDHEGEHHLGPTTEDEVAGIVRELLRGKPTPAAVDELAHVTGARPGLVGPTVRDAVGRGSLQRTESGWRLVEVLRAGPSLTATAGTLLDRLSDEALALVEALAVGGATSPAVLEPVAPLDALPELEQLQVAEVVTTARRRLVTLVPPILAPAVQELTTDARRRELARALDASVARQGSRRRRDAGRRAGWWAIGGTAGESMIWREAVRHALESGDATTAPDLLRSVPVTPDHRTLLLKAAAEVVTGDARTALETLRAAARAHPGERTPILAQAQVLQHALGQPLRADELLATAMEECEPRDVPEIAATRAWLAAQRGEVDLADGLLERRHPAEGDARLTRQAARRLVLLHRLLPPEVDADALERRAARTDDPFASSRLRADRAHELVARWTPRTPHRLETTLATLPRRTPTWATWAAATAEAHALSGDLDTALPLLEEAVAILDRTDPWRDATRVQAVAARIVLTAGHHARGRELLASARGRADPGDAGWIEAAERAEAFAAGDPGTVCSSAERTATRARRRGDVLGELSALLDAARAGGDVAARLDDLRPTVHEEAWLVRIDVARAMLGGDATSLSEAAHQLAASGLRCEAVRGLSAAASLHVRAGAIGASIAAAQEAVATLATCRGVVRTPVLGLLTADAVTELTPRELEVAALAASGATNQAIADGLFISVRTVENHLAHVYTKLGISGRVQLAGHTA